LEDKVSAFFAQRATLALSHVGHLQDPTDPTSLALDAESHADFLPRLRFSTHTLTANRVRRLSDQELQHSVSAFLDLRPDGFAFHQKSKRIAILEFTRAMDSSEQYQERFWRRRLDRIGLDTINKELLAIEFKRTRDARSNYVEKAIAVAQEQ
jgi:hypothetical protein